MGKAGSRAATWFRFLMSSHKPSEEHTETAQTLSRKHVVVTGAGFTYAFVPDAPLLVDDFNNDVLKDKARGLPYASQLLDWEQSRHPEGHIFSFP